MEKQTFKWQSPDLYQKIPQSLPFRPNLLRHIQTNTIVTLHRRVIPISNIEAQLKLYFWRYTSDYPVIKAFCLEQITSFEKRASQQFEIYLEAPQQLLGNLQQIQIDSMLSIMRTCLSAMGKLAQKFGYFAITEKMIAINFENECKIWINEILHENRVAWPLPDEQSMIKQLLNILKLFCKKCVEYQRFFHSAYRECINIPKAMDYISKFSYNTKTLIPFQISLTPSLAQSRNGSFSKFRGFNFSKIKDKQPPMTGKKQLRRNLSFAHPNTFKYPSFLSNINHQRKFSEMGRLIHKKNQTSRTVNQNQTPVFRHRTTTIQNQLINQIPQRSQYSTNQSLKICPMNIFGRKPQQNRETRVQKMKALVKERINRKSCFYQQSQENSSNTPQSIYFEEPNRVRDSEIYGFDMTNSINVGDQGSELVLENCSKNFS